MRITFEYDNNYFNDSSKQVVSFFFFFPCDFVALIVKNKDV